MTKRRRWICAAALIALAAGGPAHAADTCPEGSGLFAEYRMFFGRSTGGEEVVSDAAWRQFLGREVTPRFPDGLTVLDGAGQWRNAEDAIERERSKLLVVIAPPGPDGLRRIEEIADAYKRRFRQDSVLRVIGAVCASF